MNKLTIAVLVACLTFPGLAIAGDVEIDLQDERSGRGNSATIVVPVQETEQSQSQSQSYVGTLSTTIKDKNNQEVTFVSPKQAPGATAPGLSASNGTCMGSSSAGVSGPWGGLSIGSNWKDEDCNIRYFAGMAEGMGLHEVALTLLSQNKMFFNALVANHVAFIPYGEYVVEVTRNTGGFVDPEGASD